jgi:glycosyltransferase involved in cell wall biosynthesis
MKRSVIIATWFYYDQPGFLDFLYRIKSISHEYDVTLVLRDAAFEKEFQGIPARVVVLHQPGQGKKPLFKFIWQLATLVRTARPDLLVLLGSQLALATILLPQTTKVLYWNEHPTHFFTGHIRRPLRQALGNLLVWMSFLAARRANLVMPIGEAHRDDLLAHGVPAQKIQMHYMGVADRFAALGATRTSAAEPQCLNMVYTGTVQKERGRDVMLEGVALARTSGIPCHLTIVGAMGAEMEYCQRRVVELRIADAVELVGRVPGEEIPGYLQRADFGICIWADRVWWRFNPPTKLFEYLVAGLPVLGSRIRTHTEYVRDGENGFIFDYDAEAFAKALVRSWEARQHWSQMATTAAAEGRNRYLWSSIAPDFLQVLDRLIGADQRQEGVHPV